MIVERFKYVIWAADMDRAVQFYTTVFGGTVLKQNDIISEVSICGGIIGIHGGGEGTRTWTGLSFQVPDVIAGAQEIVAAGGQLVQSHAPTTRALAALKVTPASTADQALVHSLRRRFA